MPCSKTHATGRITRLENTGDGLVRFDAPVDHSNYGVLSSETEKLGYIWDLVNVGTKVTVEVQTEPDVMPIITSIELTPS